MTWVIALAVTLIIVLATFGVLYGSAWLMYWQEGRGHRYDPRLTGQTVRTWDDYRGEVDELEVQPYCSCGWRWQFAEAQAHAHATWNMHVHPD